MSAVELGWSRMSGRRASGTSRPSLGAQVLAVFYFISSGKLLFKKCLEKRLDIPDILLSGIRSLLIYFVRGGKTIGLCLWTQELD